MRPSDQPSPLFRIDPPPEFDGAFAWEGAVEGEAAGDAEVESPSGEQFLIFTAAGTDFAAPLANIVEVGDAPLVTPLPCVPDWVLGVSNVRGDILSVLDLRTFFGLPPGAA